MNRSRAFALVACLAVSLGADSALAASPPLVRAEMHATRPEISQLSWDTEGGPRVKTNLLRSGQAVGLRMKIDGQWKQGAEFATVAQPAAPNAMCYRTTIMPRMAIVWKSSVTSDALTMAFSIEGAEANRIEGLELRFPFDPHVTPVTVLPGQWADDGSLRLPVVISAPDFGQMLLTDKGKRP